MDDIENNYDNDENIDNNDSDNCSEAKSSRVTRLLTSLLALLGLYPQYRAVRTILIGLGITSGDWETYHKESSKIYILEPVAEGILQLFVQSNIIYIVAGPGESKKFWKTLGPRQNISVLIPVRPIDLSSLAYQSSFISKFLYFLLLSSTAISVCHSFAKLLRVNFIFTL